MLIRSGRSWWPSAARSADCEDVVRTGGLSGRRLFLRGRKPGRADAWRYWYLISRDFRLAACPGLSVVAPPHPPGALSSPFVLPRACLAAARGPGRPGMRRCRRGGLACLRGDRVRGQEAGGPDDWRCRTQTAGISGPQQVPELATVCIPPCAGPGQAFATG